MPHKPGHKRKDVTITGVEKTLRAREVRKAGGSSGEQQLAVAEAERKAGEIPAFRKLKAGDPIPGGGVDPGTAQQGIFKGTSGLQSQIDIANKQRQEQGELTPEEQPLLSSREEREARILERQENTFIVSFIRDKFGEQTLQDVRKGVGIAGEIALAAVPIGGAIRGAKAIGTAGKAIKTARGAKTAGKGIPNIIEGGGVIETSATIATKEAAVKVSTKTGQALVRESRAGLLSRGLGLTRKTAEREIAREEGRLLSHYLSKLKTPTGALIGLGTIKGISAVAVLSVWFASDNVVGQTANQNNRNVNFVIFGQRDKQTALEVGEEQIARAEFARNKISEVAWLAPELQLFGLRKFYVKAADDQINDMKLNQEIIKASGGQGLNI